jgi:hypothetical protein
MVTPVDRVAWEAGGVKKSLKYSVSLWKIGYIIRMVLQPDYQN